MSEHVLIIDDDEDMCALLAHGLQRRGFQVTSRQSGDTALAFIGEDAVDAIVTDLSMPGMNGIELCERIVLNRPDVPVIILTALGSLETATSAIRAGADDFITKPPDVEVLTLALRRAIRHRLLRDEVKLLRRRMLAQEAGFGDLLGASPCMQQVYDFLERIARSDASALITGESGTGKELVARALHVRGRRQRGPFVAVNCATVPESLIESELFGHVRGAFTGAAGDRLGLIPRANGGTFFLDEIGELPLALQPKLLRVLQERVVRPVGSNTEVPCDVRFLAATNQDLEAAVQAGRFREDLYFRINVIHVEMPPLRSRGDDVLLLAQHFLSRLARDAHDVQGLSPAAAERLLAYGWPGNVRELHNCIERAIVVARYDQIVVDDLPDRIRNYRRSSLAEPRETSVLASLEEVEQRHICQVLDAVGGNKKRCAQVLGIDRKTLQRKLDRADRIAVDE